MIHGAWSRITHTYCTGLNDCSVSSAHVPHITRVFYVSKIPQAMRWQAVRFSHIYIYTHTYSYLQINTCRYSCISIYMHTDSPKTRIQVFI